MLQTISFNLESLAWPCVRPVSTLSIYNSLIKTPYYFGRIRIASKVNNNSTDCAPTFSERMYELRTNSNFWYIWIVHSYNISLPIFIRHRNVISVKFLVLKEFFSGTGKWLWSTFNSTISSSTSYLRYALHVFTVNLH